ncbi:MAG: ABC transporter permease [Bacilli bacterium]|nr:ABC transporter permease [Bacilli bacterium]
MKFRFQRKYLSIPYMIFMALFIIVPILLIAYYAFSNADGQLSLDAAKKFFSDSSKFDVIMVSLFIAIQTTLICLIIGYPIAYFLASKEYNHNVVLVMLFIMPMWINFVLRTAATRDILFAIGLTGGDYPYLATLIGMVYNYLPFVILPLYTTMLKLDRSQMEAAADLGASPVQVFIKNVIPQSLPGIISAITMTLMPVMSSYVISDALAEGNITLIGNSIYLSFANSQWNNGSFTALLLLILVLISMWATSGKSEDARANLW